MSFIWTVTTTTTTSESNEEDLSSAGSVDEGSSLLETDEEEAVEARRPRSTEEYLWTARSRAEDGSDDDHSDESDDEATGRESSRERRARGGERRLRPTGRETFWRDEPSTSPTTFRFTVGPTSTDAPPRDPTPTRVALAASCSKDHSVLLWEQRWTGPRRDAVGQRTLAGRENEGRQHESVRRAH